MSEDTNILVTTDEAVKQIKTLAKGWKIYAVISGDAPIVQDGIATDKVFGSGFYGSVEISRAQALKLMTRFLSKALEDRGARIPLRLSPYTFTNGNTYGGAMFIG